MGPRRGSILALVMVAAALLLAACGDDGTSATKSRGSGAASDSSGSAAQAPSGTQAAVGAQDSPQKVIVDSTLQLEVKELRAAYLKAGDLVRSFGGFVADSTIDDQGGDTAKANLKLRVPASHHDELLGALRVLGGGKVLKETTTAKEVTAEFTDLQSRLTNLRRAETQYQDLVKQATTVDAVLKVQAQLDTVRGQIEQAQGRLNLLGDLVDFSTITLSLSVPGASAGQGIPGPRRVFVDAWDASVVVARVVLNVAIVLVVAAIWLTIPALILFFGIRYVSRRRPPRPPVPPRMTRAPLPPPPPPPPAPPPAS